MTEINYNFAQNFTSIGNVTDHLNAVQEVRNDIDSMFKTLSSVYDGAGQAALQDAHIKVSNMIDEALHNMLSTQRAAEESQQLMADLDRANAHDFNV
jgi:hypothetical protein